MFYKNEIFIQGFIKLIKECNEIVLNIYKTDFNVITKEDESPLTLADKECNDHICDYLKNIKINNSGIISEEIKNDSYDKRKDLEWTCTACTYHNTGGKINCFTCGNPRKGN